MLATASSFAVAYAEDPTIYSWRAENGNVVFSETKPSSDIDYKVVSVGKPTIVDTKAPQKSADGKDVKIDQSDIEKLANSKLAEENKKVLAGIMGILFGGFGIHKFILGYSKEGVILLIATIVTCGLASLVGLIEGIIYLTKTDEEFYQTYQVGKKPWF